jgi:hypothetical protein
MFMFGLNNGFFLTVSKAKNATNSTTMKHIKLNVLTCVGLLIASAGYCQTYYAHTTTSSIMEPGGGGLAFSVEPGVNGRKVYMRGESTLEEIITIDPVLQTIRQSGHFFVPIGTSKLHISQALPAQFPHPPLSIEGELTLSIVGGGVMLPFDTGARTVSWNGSSYSMNAWVTTSAKLEFLYSLETGDKIYTGAFSYDTGPVGLWLFGAVDVGNYPASIVLNPYMNCMNDFTPAGSSALNLLADNGFSLEIVPNLDGIGLEAGTSLLPTTAVLVPEPETGSLVALFGGMLLCLKKTRRNA